MFDGKKTAPNFFNGSITLKKSLFDKLLSPTNFIVLFDAISNPNINLAQVPEFPAFKTIPFLYTKLLIPLPKISQYFFFY